MAKALDKHERKALEKEATNLRLRRKLAQGLVDTEDQRLHRVDLQIARLKKQRTNIVEDVPRQMTRVKLLEQRIAIIEVRLQKSGDRVKKQTKLTKLRATIRALEAEL